MISSRGLRVSGAFVEAVDVFEKGNLDLATGVSVLSPDPFGLGDLKTLSTAELS